MAILKRNKKEETREVVSHLLDIISPVVFKFEPKKIISGDLYQRTLVIIDFPSEPDEGWLSRVANLPFVTTAIHLEPTDPYNLIKQIKISMGDLEGKLMSSGNPYYIEQTRNKLDDTKKMLKKIDREQQQVVDMTVVLTVQAHDLELLEQRTRKVEAALAGNGMRGRVPMLKQELAYRTVGPWGILESKIRDIGRRNMPVSSAAASFPFVYSGLNDGKGILLGKDETGGIVLLDVWQREESRTNSNIIVLGKPGVGKSTVIKKILRGEYGRGVKIIIIDPEREYKELCENVDGTWIDCGGGTKGRINPLQVRAVPVDDDDTPEEERMYKKDVIERGPLAMHFQTLRTFFKLYKDINKEEMAYLEIVLEATYENKNITWSTKPEDVPNDKWPIMKDAYETANELYEESKDENFKKIALYLRSAAVGADAFLWNGHTTIKADSDFVVLDIHTLLEADSSILRAQFFNILGWSWNEVSVNREEKILLGTDETYLLIDPENPQALQFLRNTNKRIRKYEGGLLVITHNLVDFMDPSVRRFGQALLDNPTYKLLMGQGDKDIEALTKLMTLSEREEQILKEGKRGKALLVAGNKRLDVSIQVTDKELVLFGKGGGR